MTWLLYDLDFVTLEDLDFDFADSSFHVRYHRDRLEAVTSRDVTITCTHWHTICMICLFYI